MSFPVQSALFLLPCIGIAATTVMCDQECFPSKLGAAVLMFFIGAFLWLLVIAAHCLLCH